jgi:hypothetical protein
MEGVDVSADDMRWMLTDVCSGLLDADAAESLVEQVRQLGTAAEQAEVPGRAVAGRASAHGRRAERDRSPPPDSAVSKSARKAAFAARSAR